MGETPEVAAEVGGREVSLAVLAATLTTAIVFFPVISLDGVSRFLFVALAMAVVLSLLRVLRGGHVSSFSVLRQAHGQASGGRGSWSGSIGARFGAIAKGFNAYFEKLLGNYDRTLSTALLKPLGDRGRPGGNIASLFFPLSAVGGRVLSRAPILASL